MASRRSMSLTLRRLGSAITLWAVAGCAASAPIESAPAESAQAIETGSVVVLPVTAQASRPSAPVPAQSSSRLAKSTASLVEKEIVLPAAIQFEQGRETIRPESHDALLALVDLMAAHPEILLIEVGVHTDGRGSSEFNRALTQARADALRTFFVDHGLAQARLVAVGFGEDRPKSADPDVNRRVEVLVKQVR
jgi:outer membrane protein OmpA-like peptidoglycan-associated protein